MEERSVLLHNFTADGDRISVFERHRLTPRDPGGGRGPDRHRRQELKRHVATQAAGMCLQVRNAPRRSVLQSCLSTHLIGACTAAHVGWVPPPHAWHAVLVSLTCQTSVCSVDACVLTAVGCVDGMLVSLTTSASHVCVVNLGLCNSLPRLSRSAM